MPKTVVSVPLSQGHWLPGALALVSHWSFFQFNPYTQHNAQTQNTWLREVVAVDDFSWAFFFLQQLRQQHVDSMSAPYLPTADESGTTSRPGPEASLAPFSAEKIWGGLVKLMAILAVFLKLQPDRYI